MFITLANEQTTKTKRFAKTLEKNSLYSQRCSSYHFLLSLTKKTLKPIEKQSQKILLSMCGAVSVVSLTVLKPKTIFIQVFLMRVRSSVNKVKEHIVLGRDKLVCLILSNSFIQD